MSGEKLATKKCRECRSEIEAGAKRCPHCKAKQGSWFGRHPIITVFGTATFFVTFLAVLGSGGGGSNQVDSLPETKQNQEVPIKISAVVLSEQYDANKIAADAKYKNKLLEINGVIHDIGKDILDTPYLVLEGRSGSLFGVQCMFKRSNENKLAVLSKGRSIVLRGRVSAEFIGNVIVDDCVIVE